MEQRIGSSSQPLEGAGFDPAFIPGLTSPVSGEPADAKSEEPEDVDDAAEPEERVSDEAVSRGTAPAAAKASEDSEPGEASDSDDEHDERDAPEGPVFEASDRRAKIVADHKGARLALDDQACEFRWDEIGAIETEVPRFGKRFTVTVHTPDRRWYPIEIEATSRSRFTEWDEQLDAVMDVYFEDGEADTGDAGAKDADTEDTGIEDTGTEDADTKDAGTKDGGAKDTGAKDADTKRADSETDSDD